MMMSPKKIFLDVNVLSYMQKEEGDFESLEKLPSILKEKNLRLVVSVYTLFEIKRFGDEIARKNIFSVISKCNPLYIWPAYKLRESELKVFLGYESIMTSYALSITEYLNPETCCCPELITSDLSKLVEREDFQVFRKAMPIWLAQRKGYGKIQNQDCDRFLQNIIKSSLNFIFCESPTAIEEKTNYCLKNKKNLLLSCPSIFVYYNLYIEFYSNQKRKVEEGQYFDNQYMVSALAYCDYFITEDKGLTHLAKAVSQKNIGVTHKVAKIQKYSESVLKK